LALAFATTSSSEIFLERQAGENISGVEGEPFDSVLFPFGDESLSGPILVFVDSILPICVLEILGKGERGKSAGGNLLAFPSNCKLI
jgi:hypothetical protein